MIGNRRINEKVVPGGSGSDKQNSVKILNYKKQVKSYLRKLRLKKKPRSKGYSRGYSSF